MPALTILFMCPHNAAKSTLAGAYCRQLAAAAGLDWRVLTAGTAPDAAPAPAVLALLRREGLDQGVDRPHRVTPAELAAADWIVNLGCDLDGLAPPGTAVADWADVPAPSQDLLAARRVIRQRLRGFLEVIRESPPLVPPGGGETDSSPLWGEVRRGV